MIIDDFVESWIVTVLQRIMCDVGPTLEVSGNIICAKKKKNNWNRSKISLLSNWKGGTSAGSKVAVVMIG